MKRLKGWDQYVQDAKREPIELPLPDGETLTIRQPTGGVTRRINRAQRTGDEDDMCKALFGDDGGELLLKLFEDAPGSVLQEIVLDVLREFGLAPDQVGDSTASPT